MSFQVISSAGATATFDGIFIPATDLAAGGIGNSSEFDVAVSADIKKAKGLYAILLMLTTEISSLNALDRLGFSATPPNINSQAHTFTMTTQRYVKDNVDTKPTVVPVPDSGANDGRGDFSLNDIFPNASLKANTGDLTEAGVFFPVSVLQTYGCPDYYSLNLGSDSRDLIHSFMRWVTLDVTTFPSRSASVASAITARSSGTSSEIAIPATYIAGTDPISGLVAADAPITHLLSSGNMSISIDTIKSISGAGAQTWEVNVATA